MTNIVIQNAVTMRE